MDKVEIIVPEGMEIDTENSTFDCIKFKPKSLTYEYVANKLFKNGFYYLTNTGNIHTRTNPVIIYNTSSKSEKQLQKLIAINKLMNVAKYLNGNWKPNWDNIDENKYYIFINNCNVLFVDNNDAYNKGVVYFKSKKLAQQAIDILGEETVKLALSTDW